MARVGGDGARKTAEGEEGVDMWGPLDSGRERGMRMGTGSGPAWWACCSGH